LKKIQATITRLFIAGAESIKLIGANLIDRSHQNISWQRQFEYAEKLDLATLKL
jgi:hypothetical protein